MRVLLASVEDARDITSWSGTPFHMRQALVDAGIDLVDASPLRERLGLPLKAVQAARNRSGTRYYSRLREPVIVDGYAAQVRRAVERHAPDLVLAPSTLPVARLRVDVPVVTWTDATFAGLLGFYPDYTGISRRYERLGHAMEQEALDHVSLAVYSSDWATRTAADAYGVSADRLAVVPYGANISDPGPVHEGRADGACRLLLVGRGWERKGVDLAIATAALLHAGGIPVVLDVVGSEAPARHAVPSFVRVHGALEKDDPQAALILDQLYDRASFFLLPTRADCTPIVLAEAQAHGIPVVTSAAGGTASMVHAGRSGFVVPLADFPAQAATRIARAWSSEASYLALRQGARRQYEETLNWTSAVAALLDELRSRGLPGTAVASSRPTALP